MEGGEGDGGSVLWRCTPADLVHDDEGTGGGLAEDGGGLEHLDHEGGLGGVEVVRGAEAGEDCVDQAELGVVCWDEGADLGEDRDEGGLTEEGGFAGHVWASDEPDAAVLGRG